MKTIFKPLHCISLDMGNASEFIFSIECTELECEKDFKIKESAIIKLIQKREQWLGNFQVHEI
jgi:hypothetical protein